MNPLFKDGVTLAVALLGAVLGVINLWRSVVRDQVKLAIIPQNFYTSDKTDGLCFEIVNLGFTAVTIAQVGVELEDKKSFFGFPFGHGSNLPHRLESRASFTVYWTQRASEHRTLAGGKRAFVKTACGRVFHGTSPALKGRIEFAKAAQTPPPPMPTKELEEEMNELRRKHHGD